ncbi:MAG: FAD/NAD(P)-binding protein [Candidatus Sericytochromatia bacterium]
MNMPLLPKVCQVQALNWENTQTFTLSLSSPTAEAADFAFRPGQFNMLYVFGVGEVPISLSGSPQKQTEGVHTIRKVGSVTAALADLKPGQELGWRGPYGSAWPLHKAAGKDLLIVAGGLGLAPVRPVIYAVLAQRERYRRVILLCGARQESELLFTQELLAWQAAGELEIQITLDQAGQTWNGPVGVVTTLIQRLELDPSHTLALVCGPEIMMRFSAQELLHKGLKSEQIYLSLERNMQCAVGFCGHCQYGPHFICKDGPVFRLDRVQRLLETKEV